EDRPPSQRRDRTRHAAPERALVVTQPAPAHDLESDFDLRLCACFLSDFFSDFLSADFFSGCFADLSGGLTSTDATPCRSNAAALLSLVLSGFLASLPSGLTAAVLDPRFLVSADFVSARLISALSVAP